MDTLFSILEPYAVMGGTFIPKADLYRVCGGRHKVDPYTIRLQTREAGAPEPKVAMRMGGKDMVNVHDAVEFIKQLDDWRSNTEARAAARKADEERRFWDRFNREQARLKANGEGLEAMQQGSAEGRALAESAAGRGPITRG